MKRIRSLRILGATLPIIVILIMSSAWAASKYKTLHKFTGGADGELPNAALILDQAGNLYGITSYGGAASIYGGTVFKLTPNTHGGWTKSVLYNFCSVTNCADGQNPYGSVTFDQAGNLYGTTVFGGNSAGGTIFKLAPNADGTWTESVLYSFCSLTNCGDGEYPFAGLIYDQTGNLYGMTTEGGASPTAGTIFNLAPNADGTWTESVLYSFCSLTNCGDGFDPQPGLVFDAKGNLYGTTTSGGNSSCGGNGCGVVFKLTPKTGGIWREKVLHRFTGGKDGSDPHSVLLFDQAGNLYGTAQLGGNLSQCRGHGCGVVFKLTQNADGSWKEKVLHTFTGGKDGGQPFAGLIFDQAENLYGTTTSGGNLSYCGGGGCGVVFKLAPNSKGGWNEILLHNFADHPGDIPFAGLVFDLAGNLYGTTNGDQVATFGSVFEITP
jgi:uncharacterized repeat protein (TIGR03803 family)